MSCFPVSHSTLQRTYNNFSIYQQNRNQLLQKLKTEIQKQKYRIIEINEQIDESYKKIRMTTQQLLTRVAQEKAHTNNANNNLLTKIINTERENKGFISTKQEKIAQYQSRVSLIKDRMEKYSQEQNYIQNKFCEQAKSRTEDLIQQSKSKKRQINAIVQKFQKRILQITEFHKEQIKELENDKLVNEINQIINKFQMDLSF